MKGIEGLKTWQSAIEAQRDPDATWIAVCAGTGCLSQGAADLAAALREALIRHGLEGKVDVKETGCRGFCEQGPLIVIHPDGIFYPQLKADHAERIVTETILRKQVIEELLYRDPTSGRRYVHEGDIPFYRKQMRLVCRLNGQIDPTHI
ncbi:MAG: (2Fe-2S) ferredoxin domain-containing protein, partial [Armatimonadetes bacterium]|nr:(2Fe-2S) ferredoxin domain-containing protein [Armatimonadota bacterium]